MRLKLAVSLIGCIALPAQTSVSKAQDAPLIYADQGQAWTPAARSDFYDRDQGARMIPLAWLSALRQPSGAAFLDDHLARYGYLPNPDGVAGLPVGFTASGPDANQSVGMTCSACHTRQIVVNHQPIRIDGGPAIVDFQSLLADLDKAMGQVVDHDDIFQTFAKAVLGAAAADIDQVASLREDIAAWYLRYHTLMTRALPDSPWGPSRLDAVGMIFDRLTGLDLGPAPSFLIPDNIRKADAPVRYPFLWNAPIQDMTQWPGFADNGNDLLGLSRNLGEVFGVFGTFHPVKDPSRLLGWDYTGDNSANFDGLTRLESLVKKIGPPVWPPQWPIDAALRTQGEAVFNRSTETGGCVGCHGIKTGKFRDFLHTTWATPIQDVHTDTREHGIITWTAKTGSLEGAQVPFKAALGATDSSFNILATSVIGSIIENYIPFSALARRADLARKLQGTALRAALLPAGLDGLKGAFHAPEYNRSPEDKAAAAPVNAYESRVMQGIWAAAPYLHNGSVPTLADLLKPAVDRPKAFKIGPAYDIDKVGLAADQTAFGFTLQTTDCSDLNSGNSRCGHEYGTSLPEADKKALLEYLKTL